MEIKGISRREFLYIAGLSASAAAIGGVSHATRSLNFSRSSLNIGLLFPQETTSQQISKPFLNGMRLASLASSQNGPALNLKFHYPMANGSILSRHGQLIENGALDVIIAFIGAYSLSKIQGQITQSSVPNLIVNPGSNLIDSPNIKNLHFHSLQQARLNFAAGYDAVSRFGPKGAILSSFYDSGFDSLYAVEKGIAAANGDVVLTEVIASDGEKRDVQKAINAIVANDPDFVYLLNSADAELASSGLLKQLTENNIPIISNEFSLSEQKGMTAGRFLNWSSRSANAESRAFNRWHRLLFGSRPNSISLLGFESAALLLEGINLTTSEANLDFNEALQLAKAISPRGEIRLNQTSLNQMVWQPYQGTVEPVVLDQHPRLQKPAYSTGWTFPYLATGS